MEFAFQNSIDYNVLTVDTEKVEEEDEIIPSCFNPTVEGAIVIIICSSLVIAHSAIFLGDGLAALGTQIRTEDMTDVLIVTTCEYIFTSLLSILIATFQLEHSISSIKALTTPYNSKKRHWGQVQVACAVSIMVSMGLAYTFHAQDYVTGQLFLVTNCVHIIMSILAVILTKHKLL